MKQDLMERTKEYALQIIDLHGILPDGEVAPILGKQLLRSGTSIGAQYREAQRTKSPLTSSARSKALSKNWKKLATGWNSSPTPTSFLWNQSARSSKSPPN